MTETPTLTATPDGTPSDTPYLYMSSGSERTGVGFGDVFALFSGGASIVNLTNYPTASDLYPVSSPDGSKILFLSDRVGTGQQIVVMDKDGTNQVQITFAPVTMDVIFSSPNWSPGGDRIVYAREVTPSGPYSLEVMDPDGSNVIPISPVGSRWTRPHWSPDGTRIYYQDLFAGGWLFSVNPDGSGVSQVSSSGCSYYGYDLSPDGTRLVVSSTCLDTGIPDEILTMDLDGSNVFRLTNNSVYDWEPSWSRDGAKIAFVRRAGYDDHIWVINADGTNEIQVTFGHVSDHDPNWP